MPTTQQLEQRLARVKARLATGPSGATGLTARELHKVKRRVQRKLRVRRGATAPAAKPPAAAAPESSPPPAPAEG
jgi:hypothetical protein